MAMNLRRSVETPQTMKRRTIYLYDLLMELVRRDMKLRYKRSFLGIIWSLVNPLSQMLVLGFVFRFIFNSNIENFTIFLFIGVLSWSWFRGSLNSATGSIVYNKQLISRPGFPVGMLPVVAVMTHWIHFILALPILVLFLVVARVPITIALITLPLIMVIQFILSLSLAYILAAIHVTFRDTQYLLEIFLMLGFYLSPIFYSVSTVPDKYVSYYYLNPMVHIITAYRDIFLWGQFPSLVALTIVAGLSIVALWGGYTIFKSASFRFVEEA